MSSSKEPTKNLAGVSSSSVGGSAFHATSATIEVVMMALAIWYSLL